MKTKGFVVVAIVLTLAFAGTVLAAGGMGLGKGMGPGCCPMQAGAGAATLTPEQAAKQEAFQKETAAQREKIYKLHQEMWSLRNQQTPNWDAVNAKHQEIFTLKTDLMKKAQAAGIAGYGMGMRGGMGKGRGCCGGCF